MFRGQPKRCVPNFILATLWLCLSTSCGSSTPAHAGEEADTVMITTLNGNYDPDHADQLDVKTGDIVSISADSFSGNNDQLAPQGRDGSNFIWRSSYNSGDYCDASQEQDCLQNSHFEVTDTGVNYYLPEDAQDVVITVSLRDDPTLTDTLHLHNSNVHSVIDPVVDPEDLPSDPMISTDASAQPVNFDVENALEPYGNYVTVADTRYFVPNRQSPDWAPYQNGHWVFVPDNDQGWTFISNDPWGWVTEHYGHWRRHERYGWIWAANRDRVYRPHCATFTYTDDYVGWYPYYAQAHDAYAAGYEYGFVDGYWAGLNAGQGYLNNQYDIGLTYVSYNNFMAENIAFVRVTSVSYTTIFQTSFQRRQFGYFPCAARSVYESRTFIETRISRSVTVTSLVQRRVGGFNLTYPRRVYPVPSVTRDVCEGIRYNRTSTPRYFSRIPVGSVVNYQRDTRQVVVTRPTLNQRGLATPSVYRDRATGAVSRIPAQTRVPTQINSAAQNYRIPQVSVPVRQVPRISIPANRFGPVVQGSSGRPIRTIIRKPSAHVVPQQQPQRPNFPDRRPDVPQKPWQPSPQQPQRPSLPPWRPISQQQQQPVRPKPLAQPLNPFFPQRTQQQPTRTVQRDPQRQQPTRTVERKPQEPQRRTDQTQPANPRKPRKP